MLLFFVLSGYLITKILLAAKPGEGSIRDTLPVLQSFYARRILRIFPAYYALLLVSSLVLSSQVRETLGWHALYLSNYLIAFRGEWYPAIALHYWSLAIEEQFYLFWPFVVLLVPRERLALTFLLLALSAPVFRAVLVSSEASNFWGWMLPPSYFDALAGGGLLAALDTREALRRWLVRVAWLALFLWMTVSFGSDLGVIEQGVWTAYVAMDSVRAMAFIGLVALAARGFHGVPGSLLLWRPLRFIGAVSYGIYLYHLAVELVVRKAVTVAGGPVLEKGPVLFLAASALTVLVASASWFFLERPILGLKKRFSYQNTRRARRAPLPEGAHIQKLR